jgi:MFS family permease
MFSYITTTTVPSFPELQEQYNLTVDLVNWTVAIPALGLAIGPLLWSSFADIIGRRVILIAGTLVAFAATIGAAKASSYGGYMAARLFQGLGVSPAATVGLSIINDIFFDHERGTKIGLWVLSIDVGLFVGPLFGGFMDLVSHIWIQWLVAIFFGAIIVCEVVFLPETLYPRDFMLASKRTRSIFSTKHLETEKIPGQSSKTAEPGVVRTKKLPFINVKPIPALKHPKPWDSMTRFIRLFRFAVIPGAVLVFCFSWYWWVLSIATMLPVAYANYSPQIQGYVCRTGPSPIKWPYGRRQLMVAACSSWDWSLERCSPSCSVREGSVIQLLSSLRRRMVEPK